MLQAQKNMSQRPPPPIPDEYKGKLFTPQPPSTPKPASVPQPPKSPPDSAKALPQPPSTPKPSGTSKPMSPQVSKPSTEGTGFAPKPPALPKPSTNASLDSGQPRFAPRPPSVPNNNKNRFIPQPPNTPKLSSTESISTTSPLPPKPMAARSNETHVGEHSTSQINNFDELSEDTNKRQFWFFPAKKLFSFKSPFKKEYPLQNNHLEDLDDRPQREAWFSPTKKLKEYRELVYRCQQSNHAFERALIGFISVCLLWATSLAVCQAVVMAVILSPPLPDVIDAAVASMQFTDEQKILFEQCTARLILDCERNVNSSYDEELLRVTEAQQSNRRAINELYALRDFCNLELNGGIETFTYLQSNSNLTNPQATYPTALGKAVPADPRCTQVDSLLNGGAGGMQSLSSTNSFQASANAQVDTSLNAYNARYQYNVQYKNNKTQELHYFANTTLPGLLSNNSVVAYYQALRCSYCSYLSCVYFSSQNENFYVAVPECVGCSGGCDPQDTVLYKLQQIQSSSLQAYTQAKSVVLQWDSQAQNTINQIVTFYNNLKTNSALRAAIDFLLQLDSLSLAGMGFYSIGNLNFGSLSLPSITPPFSIDSIFTQLQADGQGYLTATYQEQLNFLNAQENLLQQQLNLPNNFGLPPYSPPHVNTSSLRQQFQNSTNTFLASMATSLAGAKAKGADQTQAYTKLTNVTTVTNVSTSLLANISPQQLSFYVYSGFSITTFELAWASIISLSLSLDYAYRVFRTVRLIKKYWKVSAVNMPPADVRIDILQDSSLQQDNSNTVQKAARCIAHPTTVIAIVAIFAGLMLSILVTLYLPIYDQFVQGCIDPNVNITTGGTVLYKNVYEVSYQYAYSVGQSVSTSGVDHLNAQNELDCNKQTQNSQSVYEADVQEYNFVYNQFTHLQYESLAIDACINISEVQSNYPKAAGIATKGNFSTLPAAIPGSNCSASAPTLIDSIFQCSNYNCTAVICLDLSVPNLRADTWQASCMAEMWVHTNLLGSIMVVVIYISVNCSRVMTMHGIVRVAWRHLTDGRFSFVATCTRSGELKFPRAVTEKQYSMKRAIRESLAYRIRVWQLKSFGYILVGILVNLPWIVILITLKNTMESNPDLLTYN